MSVTSTTSKPVAQDRSKPVRTSTFVPTSRPVTTGRTLRGPERPPGGRAARAWDGRGVASGRIVLSYPVSPARTMRTAPKLRKSLQRRAPGLGVERELWAAGHEVVVGMDEVGKGAWAGPLTIGAAVLPPDRRVNKVRDSKML